ncbi:site-specific integrase [Nocardia arizonensis]|uniref:site-specific integrase n=1 Tax=Nocardia arizonensis TaxID=1141647 RepID=UPI000AD46209|nr:tyrosine-type recombinase/integrase [Nocardia arizonensis]
MAGRPPLPVGTWGNISRKQLDTNHWRAVCRVRDHDGITRTAYRVTPDGVSDRFGAAAERRLLEHLRERVYAGHGDINGETTIEQLWTEYRTYLIEVKKRATNTILRYDRVATAIKKALGGLRLREVTTQRLERFLRDYAKHSGSDAKGARTVLSGMCAMAVRFDVWKHNPVRETEPIEPKPTQGATALTLPQLRQLLIDVRHSDTPCLPLPKMKDGILIAPTPKYRVPTVAQFCDRGDLADPITMFAATGARISQLLAFLLEDYDQDTGIIPVRAHIIRIPGKGLVRETDDQTPDNPKNHRYEIQLPAFGMAMLERRIPTLKPMNDGTTPLFQSSTGTLRDPTNFNDQWRRVRLALGIPDTITGHSFRKLLIDLGLDAGLSAVMVADQVGHANPTETLNTYPTRGRANQQMADTIQNAVYPSQVFE